MRPDSISDSVTDFAQFARLRAEARGESPEALRKTAQQFEALLTQQMLKSMRAASIGDDVLGSSQTQFYQEMFDQQIAQHLSAGRGLGVADLMVRQLQAREAGGLGEAEGGRRDAQQLSVAAPATVPLRIPASMPRAEAQGNAGPALPASHLAPPEPRLPPAGPQAFVEAVLPHAEKAAAELGVPARVLVAQAALETGWGRRAIRHDDGRPAFNLFGIKADKRWEGQGVQRMTQEFENGEMRPQRAAFRAYGSIEQSFSDYVHFLKSNPRYADALRHGGDARRFAAGLQKAGYATDPAYAQKIMSIAEGRTMKVALAQTGASAPRTLTV